MKSFFLLFCLLISFSSVIAQKVNKVDNSIIIDGYKNQFRNAKSLKTKALYADSIVDKLYYSNQDEALVYNDSMLYYALQLNDSILLVALMSISVLSMIKSASAPPTSIEPSPNVGLK